LFEQLVSCVGQICKFYQNWPNGLEISQFFDFQDATILNLGFSNFNFWSPVTLGGLMCIAVTKYRQNWSNGCGDIAFNDFPNGSYPQS